MQLFGAVHAANSAELIMSTDHVQYGDTAFSVSGFRAASLLWG